MWTNVRDIDKVLRRREACKFDLLLLCDVCTFKLETELVVEVYRIVVVSTDIEAEVCRVMFEHVLNQFAADALTLTTCSNSDPHQVGALRDLDMVLLLQFPLLLNVSLGRFLDKERGITYDRLSVFLLSNDDFVDC